MNYIPLHRLLVDQKIEGIRFIDNRNCSTASTQYKFEMEVIYSIIDHIKKSNAKKIFLVSQDRCFFLASILAAFQIGIPVFLPHSQAPNLLEEIMQQGDLLLTEETILCKKFPLNHSFSFRIFDPEQSYITFYTSGSTGNAKPITKTLRQIEKEVLCLYQMWSQKNKYFLSTVPHHHIYGFLFSLLWPICNLNFVYRFTCSTWEEALALLNSDTILISSPSHLGRLTIPDSDQTLLKLCKIFSSGAPLSFSIAKSVKKKLGTLPIEVYGSTETGGIAYRQQVDLNTPWIVFPKIEIEMGERQCLKIKSPYINSSLPYQTQDRVEKISSNTFQLLGRSDRVAKIEGKRVCLSEIEKRALLHQFVKEAVAIPLNSSNRDEIGVIIVLSTEGEQKLASVGKIVFTNLLKGHLRLYFDPVLIPRRWRFVSSIPLNTQGKYFYSELKQFFHDQ